MRGLAAGEAAGGRAAFGVPPPPGLPQELLEPVKDPLGDLVSRWARTHGPFRAEDLAARWGAGVAVVRSALERLAAQERVPEGEFPPRRPATETASPRSAPRARAPHSGGTVTEP